MLSLVSHPLPSVDTHRAAGGKGLDFKCRCSAVNAALLMLLFAATAAAQRPSRRYWAMGRDVFINHCAVCHHQNSGTRAPLPRVLRQMSQQEILQALRTGAMKAQGSELSRGEQEAVARFLSRRRTVLAQITTGFCTKSASPSLNGYAGWNGWGNGPANMRFQPASPADLDRNQVKRLKLRWAFGFPAGSTVQPTVFAGRVLVGSSSGRVYSLNAQSGCIEWIFKASSGIRAAISADAQQAYVADGTADVYAIAMASGGLLWKTHIDPHPLARITGAPLLLNKRLYVPITSGEEGAAVNPYYACCTFRGGVVALDAQSGKEIWKAYTIPVAPRQTGKNAVGVATWGPSGAAVWSSPTADLRRHAIYVGTGNNYSGPPDTHSDAIIAFDMNTGRMLWSHQMTANDRWTIACRESNKANCPPNPGDDYDFGASPILMALPNGHSVLLTAQKSGMAYALDPDREGKTVWKVRIAKGGPEGGVEWGGAAGEGRAYFPVSDWRQSVSEAGGGLVALSILSGNEIWHARPVRPDCTKIAGCSAAEIAPTTLIPGVIFSGSMDGHLRAYDTRTGRVIWDFDTAREFTTTDGVAGHGGSLNKSGPTVAGGMLYVESGNYVGMPGNVLLAFSVNEQ
jgi:polyvinyl alcohol dehydrogenase (cytochrome)